MKKFVRFILVSLLISSALTALSLNHMDYGGVFDEAGEAYWGFPFSMVVSGPFYWGVGEHHSKEYVLQAIDGMQRTIDWVGIALNLTCYTLPTIFLLMGGSTIFKEIRNLKNRRNSIL